MSFPGISLSVKWVMLYVLKFLGVIRRNALEPSHRAVQKRQLCTSSTQLTINVRNCTSMWTGFYENSTLLPRWRKESRYARPWSIYPLNEILYGGAWPEVADTRLHKKCFISPPSFRAFSTLFFFIYAIINTKNETIIKYKVRRKNGYNTE